jgi:DNA-binding transcriptional LysR family regulator
MIPDGGEHCRAHRHLRLFGEAFDAAIHVGAPDWPDVEHDLLFREKVIPVLSPALAQG